MSTTGVVHPDLPRTATAVPRDHEGPPRVAVLPADHRVRGLLVDAVTAASGEVVDAGDAEAVIWAEPATPAGLDDLLDTHPAIRWVQLPWAGVEPFLDVMDDRVTWTNGKGVYAEPVAEHALALLLGGLRHVAGYARADTWSAPVGRNLLGARVTVLGGGQITRSLLRLLGPFGCRTTVVRQSVEALPGADRVVGADRLHEVLPHTDALVLALALTPRTRHVVDTDALDALPDHAWLVNVARGGHVDTDALVGALRAGTLGGAALDVTDPEPLPDDHPLWTLPNAVVTPHVGNTPEMGRPLLAARVTENVRRFGAGEPLLGPVDPILGY
jgi:phosphoglycerate dehydrogenase-like enzyme